MSRGIGRWLWGMRAWLWLESRIGFEIPLCFVLYVALKGDSLRVQHTSSFPAVASHDASSRGLCPRDGRKRPPLHLRSASPSLDSRKRLSPHLPSQKDNGLHFREARWLITSRWSNGALGHHWRCGRLKRCVRRRMAWSYRATTQSHWTIGFGSRSWHRTVERAAPRRNQSSLLDGSDD